jgi:hypothetical protein
VGERQANLYQVVLTSVLYPATVKLQPTGGAVAGGASHGKQTNGIREVFVVVGVVVGVVAGV